MKLFGMLVALGMPLLAAFPMHYYPASPPDAIQFCHLVRIGID
jgi:hypothetical protein